MKRTLFIIVLLLIELSAWAPILYVDHQFIKLREMLCTPDTKVSEPPSDTTSSLWFAANNGSSCSLFQYTVKNTRGGNDVSRELAFYGYTNGKPFRVRAWEENNK